MYKIAAFDPSEKDGPYYSYIPIDSDGNCATSPYLWTYLPETCWVVLGMETTSILDMLTVDEETLSYVLKECHHHLLQDPASNSSSSSAAAV